MSQFQVNQKVYYNGDKVTILGFTKDGDFCVIEGVSGGHNGDTLECWYDENGNIIPFVASDKNDRWYVNLHTLSPIKKIDLGLENIF